MHEATLNAIGSLLDADRTMTDEARGQILKVCKKAECPRRKLITVRQAADILGVHRRTVQRYASERKLIAIYFSKRRIRYDLDEVNKLASEGIAPREGGSQS